VSAREAVPDPVRRLLNESARHHVLTAAEERRLARAIASGDRHARQELVEANLRLVVVIARQFNGLGLSMADLVQEGSIGLMHAADRFDWDHGTRFGAYASWWIRQSIMRALSEQSRTIRLPHYLVAQQVTVRRATAALEARLGRKPTLDEIALETALPLAAIASATNATAVDCSLNDPLRDDERDGGAERLELVADSSSPDPPEIAESDEQQAMVDDAVAHLPDRERDVIQRHFGFDGERAETLEAIASDIGVTRERVRQIEQRALARLARELAGTG
jgi:RNA polymerase sigma factor (sigma-70 family)